MSPEQIYNKLADGWNTWDVRSVTTHVHLPEGVAVTLGFVIPDTSYFCRDLAWDEVLTFGEHSVDGTFTDITVSAMKCPFRILTTGFDDELLIKIIPFKPNSKVFITAEVELLWGENGDVFTQGDTITAKTPGKKFIVSTPGKTVELDWCPCRSPHLAFAGDASVYLRVNSQTCPDVIDSTLKEREKSWLASTIHSEGEFEDALSAMRRCLLWNTIYEPHRKRVVTPVTRNWCKLYYSHGDYVLFGWDTFFAALMFGMIDKNLAYANFFAMLEEMTPEGFVPNFGSGTGQTRDRSEPQIASWCAWKLYLQFGDQWFVEQIFDRLLEWNRWRFSERDGNGDGLLELASTPWNDRNPFHAWSFFKVGEKQAAMWESGLDNSPMWDDADFDEEKHCMKLSYVGLNSLIVADCECLEKMAELLGRKEEQRELVERRKHLTQLINRELWSSERGTYLNKHWNGKFDGRLSPTHFYPLMAGIPSESRASRIVDEHLLNPDEFLGDYMIPMISRDDPAFVDQNYWRGRVWAPTNFLVTEGLRRIGRNDIASHITQTGFKMFLKCWQERGVVGENYNAVTGEAAEPGKESDRFYHWGALMVYMAIQELVDFQVWDNTMRTGSASQYLDIIHNVPVGDTKKTFG